LADPGGLLALICENAALLFWDIADSEPVWLSGAELKREIAANSTNREAKLRVGWAGGAGGAKEGLKRWQYGIF